MKYLTHWLTAFVTVVLLTYVGLQDPGFKETLRLKSFDYLLANEERTPSQDITILTIDEQAIEKYGQWPWPRKVLADIIIKLRQNDTGIIVMPILFSERDRFDGDMDFCETLTYGTVIAQVGTSQKRKSNPVPRGVAKIGDPLNFLFEWDGMVGPLPELAECTNGVGVINTAPEIDGVTRRVPLLMKIGDEVYPNMAIEVIRVAVGDPSYQVKADMNGVVAMRVPGYDTINTDTNGRIWVRWNKDFRVVSAGNDEDFQKAAGTTVIIAMTAEGLGGVIATPIGEQYDYVVSANTLQTILDGETIQRADWLIELAVAFFLGCVIVLVCRFLPYWAIAIALVAITFSAGYYITFTFKSQLLFDISWILVTAFVVAFHSTFLRFILEFRAKQQIRKQFEKYLDPRQVAILVKDPSKLKLGGERKEMSFLFMDIVGFTPISEYYKNKDDPEGLVEVINDYLNRMSNIVLKNGGTIDKYMGDCIMAFWNAPLDCPNHAEMAVRTSIECAEETDKIKEEFKQKGLPDINIGSGVNTGTCIVGNMGSEARLDYSVIGDAVNLAARLEAQTRNYKDEKGKVTPTLYSSYTKEQLTNIKSVEVDKIKVKGKEELITIFKPQ
ncbi:adenylate/guanylyl cyclase [Pelagibacter phage HTVC008M]|jgi:adenylate cyclase|uniref:adenylate/guanylyl cyclase n=1 Tax=Pelagibacter phage HTVC008M TaxID=1283076 RepID=UPI0002B271A4|nr:adenylate/guanylyl cyclase [Pelagibacter phage HTVC008M]AGE60353.1 adenylate/guanylyl cyclase [Pelagibacter phage HTVC008M]